MRFLGAKSRRKFEKMAEKDSYMEEAYEMLKHMSVDEKKRLEYEAREKAIRDYHSQMQGMREEGFAEGKEQSKKAGEMRKATNIITNMLRKGKSPEEIADLTGEELEEILKFKKTGAHMKKQTQKNQCPSPTTLPCKSRRGPESPCGLLRAPRAEAVYEADYTVQSLDELDELFFRGSMNGIMGFPGASGDGAVENQGEYRRRCGKTAGIFTDEESQALAL